MPAGQPTKYKARFAKEAAKACRLGATDESLADFFDVSIATITNWKQSHPEFLASIRKAKAKSDEAVVKSLRERALGYSHKDVDIKVIDGQIVKTELVKHYPPDPTSMIFWLKNRQPKEWRERQELEMTGKDGSPLFDPALIAAAAELAKKL